MKITCNGEPREVTSTRLGDCIREVDAPYKQGCIVAIISEKKGEELKNEFSLETARGEARIKIAREKETEAISLFHAVYKQFHNDVGRIGWVSEDITAIGPIRTNLSVERSEQSYKKWDVFFGMGGFDPDLTYLMISKHDHQAAYGTGADALIGRLTRGRSIVADLKEGDTIESIRPLVTEAERIGFVTSDLNTELEEGQEIFTFITVKLSPDAPMSSEHFLSLTRDDTFHVDAHTHTYIASEAHKGLGLPGENILYRSKYTLSVRNMGTEQGKVYAYKESRLPNPAHNIFGEVIQGGDLIGHARLGDTIYAVTEPKWMMLVGKTQKEAEEFFEREKIEQVREGNKDDNAVVVDQIPALTMEIMEKGTVRTVGVEEEAVFDVVLFYEEAPRTVWYFKKITGLINRPIGYLKVFFAVPGMMVLFQGRADEAGTLLPENAPKGVVEKGMLGVTNMSRSNRGMMGIRLDESKEYGPTGEAFDGTNLVLSIPSLTPSTLTFLSKLKEGDVIYVKEKQN
ncbi:MAG: methanogenesis marker 3 protein [Methanophagales archaeon ANME-1-THS]|nr:MAG: methanogenesis marker 3 protein [Methanophagales archaeon ANME-1-THS]